MQASINHCVLLGAISPRGVEVSYHGQGTAKAAFMLVMTELGSDGKPHQLWQPVEIWGKKAEQVGELDAGALVLVDGKLRRIKKGEGWETVVSGRDCTPLQVPVLGAIPAAAVTGD
jgi:single-stranded DNA-binding protein